jgi:ABC-type dipeptide/oligopeptide/nickel transport system permease subunit
VASTEGRAKDEHVPEQVAAAAGSGGALAGAALPGRLPDTTELAAQVRARGYWELVWRRFRRDRLALAGGVFIIVLVLAAFLGAPIAQHFLGHGPNTINPLGMDFSTFTPAGPWSHVPVYPPDPQNAHASSLYILGSDGSLGRDEFLRLLYGAQVSFEVAVFATLLSVGAGVVAGAAAGYFGGWIDLIVSRLTELVMVFPFLLFAIALSSTLGPRMSGVTFGLLPEGVLMLTIIIALFSWFYPARIVRAQVLSLREKEFVEAARMTGASDWRIIRSHLLPHLVAPVVVYSTLIIATNVLAEAGLSYLGLGIPLPTASWGNLLSTASDFYQIQPWLMVWPGLAMLLTVLAFNLLGDGLRDAFDPRGNL